jgi:hypothetical protein
VHETLARPFLGYKPKEVEMKAALAALALTAVALAAPISEAQAHGGVAIRVDTPEFGFRIGAPGPVFAPLPAYAPPVYVPAPVYAPPAPVVYVPRRVVVQPPVFYPVVVPYGYAPAPGHWKHGYRHGHRGIVAVGYPYGRY